MSRNRTRVALSSVSSYSKTRRYWGREGAGILLIAKPTGKIFLAKRSPDVNEGGTWGIPGGRLDNDELPHVGAIRELSEETGYNGGVELFPAHTFTDVGFRYTNFIGIVPFEFFPILDRENSQADWFDLKKLPSPFHYGVEELFANEWSRIEGLVKKLRES